MPAAVAIPAIIGAAGQVGSSLISSNAAKGAAKTQQDAANAVAGGIQNMAQNGFESAADKLAPYLALGNRGAVGLEQALAPGGDLAGRFSFDPTQIAQNPNYQFLLQQGTQAVQNSAAAKGGLFSGGTLKSLDQYSQGLATNFINDAYSQALNTYQTNWNNLFKGYTTATGIGQDANNQYQAALNTRLNANTNAGRMLLGGADATAAGQLASGNNWSQALTGLAATAKDAYNTYSNRDPIDYGGKFDPTSVIQ